jgi:hypothetical protein
MVHLERPEVVNEIVTDVITDALTAAVAPASKSVIVETTTPGTATGSAET